ncbi:MAG: cellulase family glycosylhydrolase [Thermomicrobiales bacterium]
MRFRTRHSDNQDLFRLARSVIFLLAGLMLVSVGSLVDPLLHRGVETGSEVPYVRQTTGRELATNVDLTRFDSSQIDPILTSLQTNGFVYLRQPIAWSEVEPSDGQFDWAKLDAVINGATARGMHVIAVINDTPDWARRASELNYPDAPPANLDHLATFLRELATRYGSSLRFYQIYDRPNLPVNWGGSAPSPSEYTEILSIAYGVLRDANSESRIILAELDPYGASTSAGDDLIFMGQLYDVGAAAFFDIAAFQLDGGTRSPSDRNVSSSRINLSRAVAMRELMIERGDATKAIWATRYGWNVSGDQSHDLVAGYLWEGIMRAREEWPWMGPLFAWDLAPIHEEWAGYALLNADGTVRPQFESLANFGTSDRSLIAPTGFAPMLSNSMSYQGAWQEQHLEPQVYRTTSEVGATVTFRFEGTGLEAILRQSPESGTVRATLDGEPLPTDRFPIEDGASVIDLEWFSASDIRSTLATDLGSGTHVLELSLSTQGRLTIGGFIVTQQLAMVWPVKVLAVGGIVLLIAGFRELIYLIAWRWGHFNRETRVRPGPIWGQFSERWAHR